tara:strand:+ start:1141 stop:1818 length:678 start_codon:yes stop_codon:yes gene_type:complete
MILNKDSCKYIVVDFDGTLFKWNSFKIWIVFLFLFSWTYLGIRSYLKKLFELFNFIYLRKINELDHYEFKLNIQKTFCIDSYENSSFSVFFTFLLKFGIRKKLINYLIEQRQVKNRKVILATAAPVEYINPFAISLKIFDFVSATPRHKSDNLFDNINYQKFKNVKEIIFGSKKNFSDFEMHSDHADDMPLILASKVSVLYPPLSNQIDGIERSENIIIHYKNFL